MRKLFLSLVLSLSPMFFINAQVTCPSGEDQLIVKIVPDNYPNEISWEVRNGSSSVIASGGSIGDTLCIPTGTCHQVTIQDSYGDGIFLPGGYWVYLNGNLIANGNSFGSIITHFVGCPVGSVCSSAPLITEGSHVATFEDSWFRFNPDSTGLYELRTCGNNTCNTALWFYSNCPSVVQDGPAGSLGYNDDYCLLQSQVEIALEAGVEYLIRVGDVAGSCTGNINFMLSYSGPVAGCMDPASCNYNPNATVDDGSCIYPGNPLCQGPDLVFDSVALVTSLVLDNVIASNCDIQEGCLLQYGMRYVIKFTAKIDNHGTTDYWLGNPSTQPGMFNTNNCHGHAHYEGYGDYRLYDMNDNIIPSGHKNGYCVMDLCGFGQYSCGNMGISVNCYDIYGVGTQCQWVDITDVPTGDYRLAVVINAQHLPDALGRQEINYVNNAAQICLHITNNGPGQPPSYNLLPNCLPFVDCAGIPGGASVVDCAGNCGGSAVAGDRVTDQTLDYNDIGVYLNDIEAGNVNNGAPCIDLNGDGEVSIYDASLLKWCSFNQYTLYPGANPTYSCVWPRNIVNPMQPTFLSISYFNQNAGYMDIDISHANADIKSFQFKVSGIVIDSVSALTDPTAFPVELRWNSSNGTVAGISPLDSTLARVTQPENLVRIYFSTITDSAVCISEVTDLVNESGERTLSGVMGNCIPTNFLGLKAPKDNFLFSLQPNPARETVALQVSNPHAKLLQIELLNAGGQLVESSMMQSRNERIYLSLDGLGKGLYFVKVSSDNFYRIEKLIIE